MDQRTGKLLTMHKALHSRYGIDILYVSIKEGGRGFARTENSIDASIRGLEDYFESNKSILKAIAK